MALTVLASLLLFVVSTVQNRVVEGYVPNPTCGQKALPFRVVKGRAVSNEKFTDTDTHKRWAWRYGGEKTVVTGEYWCPNPDWVLRAPIPAPNNGFGAVVTWGSDTLFAVSAAGTMPVQRNVYIYRFAKEVWALDGTLTRATQFGCSIALWSDFLVVGASNHGTGARGQLFLYKYTSPALGWEPIMGAVESVGSQAGEKFGEKMVRDGDRLLVSIRHDGTLSTAEINPARNAAAPQSGAMVMYRRNPGAFTLTHDTFFKARAPTANDQCGTAIAMRWPFVAMGCPGKMFAFSWPAPTPVQSGMVFTYYQPTGQPWAMTDAIYLKGPTPYQYFGTHIGLGTRSMSVSAPGDISCYNGFDGTSQHQGTRFVDVSCTNSSALFWIPITGNPPRLNAEPRYIKPPNPRRAAYFALGPQVFYKDENQTERLILGLPLDSHEGEARDSARPVAVGGGEVNESGSVWILLPPHSPSNPNIVSTTGPFKHFRFHKSPASKEFGHYGSAIAVSPDTTRVLVGASGENGLHGGVKPLAFDYPQINHGDITPLPDGSGTVYLYTKNYLRSVGAGVQPED